MDKICHLTSVHPRYDIRIFEKECKSLSKYYEVFLIVADGLGDEKKDSINIIDVGRETNRLKRIFISPIKIYRVARNIDAKVYHFHDPELIPVGYKLKKSDRKVIFDIHENLYEQIKIKDWIPNPLTPIILILVKILNKFINRAFALVLAESSYENIYNKYLNSCISVLNYPKYDLLNSFAVDNRKGNGIFYIGSITQYRGLYTILDSLLELELQNVNFYMHFVGPLIEEIDWNKYSIIRNRVKFYGFLNYTKGYKIAKDCSVGLVILKPVGNYIESVPTKMLEYMSVKLPVIASNFPIWKKTIEENNCGICVNPLDPNELAGAIQFILQNTNEAGKMGINGRKAIEKKYRWDLEEKKLLRLYKNIMD